VLKTLRKKGVEFENVTLHVGAGTFKPVSHDDIRDHEMHTEQIIIKRELIEALMESRGSVIAVGTTSMRTLESIYWFGRRLQDDPQAAFAISQWEPYEDDENQPSANDALKNILHYMADRNINEVSGSTGIIIVPGYKFRLVDILLTNFHMPRSTLLLLVAAFTGEKWKDAYHYAMEHDFRFLSYGDSCLFFRQDQK
jgi:S-adenosylmethionine:tRNA ribosyltransferase-isomerase